MSSIDIKKNYVISAGFAESARLHAQHWMWNMHLGWDLHPAIDISGDREIQIADQGAGNGAWLLSLARSIDNFADKSIKMTGFDISRAHFPAPENLPSKITLDILDALSPDLPTSLIGKFDVVHLRAFAAVVKNNDLETVIVNAMKMLKPGGYLQWDEVHSEFLKAVAPRDGASISATQELLDNAKTSSKVAMNLNYDWISYLGNHFEKHGLEVIDYKRMDPKKEVRKVMTDSLLMMYDNVSKVALRNGCMPGTDKEWAKLWNNAGPEIENGVAITMDMVVCVGRKPL